MVWPRNRSCQYEPISAVHLLQHFWMRNKELLDYGPKWHRQILSIEAGLGRETFCYSSPPALRSAFLTSSYISMVSPERYVSPTAQHANSMARFNPWAGTFLQRKQQVELIAKLMCYEETHKSCTLRSVRRVLGQFVALISFTPKEDRQHRQSQTVATVVVEIVEHVGLKIDDLAPLLSLYFALVVLFCLGAFHRVYEKILQHFDSTTSNFNGTFLVLPFEEVHRHSNMSCISGASPPRSKYARFKYMGPYKYCKFARQINRRICFPSFAALQSFQENLLPSVALALWTSFSWRRDHISSRAPWESRRGYEPVNHREMWGHLQSKLQEWGFVFVWINRQKMFETL